MNLALIGCGALFDNIAAHWDLLGAGGELHLLRLPHTDAAAQNAAALLAGLDPSHTRIFAAMDTQAINHARLDVYAKARLLGFKAVSLRHPTAIVAHNAQIGENSWIGAGAVVAHSAHIGRNTIVGDMARIESNAKLGASGWIGAGASVGAGVVLGQNCLIGRDVHLAAGLQLGRHCVVDIPGAYNTSLADGTFIDPLFPQPVRIYGVSYG